MRALTLLGGLAAVLATAGAAQANGVAVPERPTFTKDVAPILFNNCVSCHRPGEVAPMALRTYDEVRPWTKSIVENVANGQMPPWHAVESAAPIANDRSLHETEVATIVKWAQQGAPKGSPADLPALPEFPEPGSWRLGEPDYVAEFEEVSLEAGGPDQFYDLRVKTEFPEDKWLKAIEVLPSNPKIAHHVIIYQADENGNQSDGWLGAWAAGTEPMKFPEGYGRVLKKGGTLIADMHYHPAETPESDRTRIGLHFSDKPLEKEIVNLWILNQEFEIPAGAKNHPARANYTFSQDAYILGFLPHLHYRGKDFTYTARYPDGKRETLLAVDNYDFNWQTNYQLAEPLFMPKGTRIDCVAHWDNSADNPNNPDPTKTVRNGNESYDEMMIGFIDFVVKDGVRPMPAEELAEQLATELAAKSDGQFFVAHAVESEGGQKFPGVVEIAPTGTSGTWHFGIMGNIYKMPISNVTQEGDTIKGVVQILGEGSYNFELTTDASGAITGSVKHPSEPWTLDVTGKKVD